MYKMGLLNPNTPRTKSANVVGATLQLNPHGNDAIYETLVRLTRDNESLLHPFIDSKGRLRQAVLLQHQCLCHAVYRGQAGAVLLEVFRGIDKDAVDMVDNYDATMKETGSAPDCLP